MMLYLAIRDKLSELQYNLDGEKRRFVGRSATETVELELPLKVIPKLIDELASLAGIDVTESPRSGKFQLVKPDFEAMGNWHGPPIVVDVTLTSERFHLLLSY